MLRLTNSLTAFLFGSGILVLSVGLFSDAFSWGLGVVGMVTLWVIAFTLRAYVVTRDDNEELNF